MTRFLTHWSRVTHICVSELPTIGSDNGLAPGRRQAIIWTNAGILLIGHLGTNLSDIVIEMYIFQFKKIHLKMSFAKWWQFCVRLSVWWYHDVLWCPQGARASAALVGLAFIKYYDNGHRWASPISIEVYGSKVSNIRRNLVSNKIVDHSDVVGASPVGAAPTTSSFSS